MCRRSVAVLAFPARYPGALVKAPPWLPICTPTHAMSDDLTPILEGWCFEPDRQSENVRTVLGDDGRKKIQIRVKCGIIQWETEGRPDGERPHGFDSMLEYCQYLLAQHRVSGAEEDELELPEDVTAAVREEIMDYYHRRVMRFQLADYRGAKADADHNLVSCHACNVV